MGKASKIMLIIAIILGILSALDLIICGAVFTYFSGSQIKETIMTGLQDGTINSSFSGSIEEVADQIQMMFKIFGIVCFVYAVASFVNVVLAIVGLATKNKIVFILNIVTGVLGLSLFNLLGGIFGLATPKEDPNKEPEIVITGTN